MKLHAMLDLRGALPVFAHISAGQYADVLWLDEVPIEPGSYLIMDRGYLDLRRLRRIALAGAFFIESNFVASRFGGGLRSTRPPLPCSN